MKMHMPSKRSFQDVILKMFLSILWQEVNVSQPFCPNHNEDYKVYDECEYPFPSGCCTLYSAFICNGVNLTNPSDLGVEIPETVETVVIANSNTPFIKNGNWPFLSNLTNLKHLSFVNNKIANFSDFNPVYLENLDNLETLAIFRNSLKFFPVELFSILKTLISLDLHCNQLKTVGEGPWNLPALDTLQLSRNQITSVQTGQFEGLRNLTNLYLPNNKITYFSLKVLDSLPKLNFLDLSFNRLVHLSEYNVFHPNLHSIHLRHNLIVGFQPQVFFGLSAVQSALLCNNDVKDPPNTTYDVNVTSIKFLSLQFNNIVKLSPLFFDGFPGLRKISVSNNRIRNIPEDTFRSVAYLGSLNMEHNEIQIIPRKLFQHLNYLSFIDLKFNNIQSLHPDIFHGLSKVNTFFLRNNPIICDCRAIPLTKWLEGLTMLVRYYPRCGFPDSLRNKAVQLAKLPTNCSESVPELVTGDSTTTPTTMPNTDSKLQLNWEVIGTALGSVLLLGLSFLLVIFVHHRN